MRKLLAGVVAGVLLLTVAACGGSGGGQQTASPAHRLATARKAFDRTPALRISLATHDLPRSVAGLLAASGVGTHQPAFKGEIKVVQSGLSLTVPVVAVDGKTWAKLGIWQQVDPGQYNAPDPARLMAPDQGLSSVLTSATHLGRATQQRQGSATVTRIDGKVPGRLMAQIVPTADPGHLFDAAFTLDQAGRATAMQVTGAFYPDAPKVTYTFSFSGYGSKATVTAP